MKQLHETLKTRWGTEFEILYKYQDSKEGTGIELWYGRFVGIAYTEYAIMEAETERTVLANCGKLSGHTFFRFAKFVLRCTDIQRRIELVKKGEEEIL